MSIQEQNTFENLLIRYLQDTASEEDYKQLLEIIKNSESQKNEIFKLKSIYDSLSLQVAIRKYPVEKSWQKMLEKLHNEKKLEIHHTRISSYLRQYWSYAAVIILMGFFLIQFIDNNKTENNESTNNYNRFVTEKGYGRSTLYLTDGTKVILNAGSTLQYPTQFDSKERIVLLDGEGYFEVAKNPEHPFIVKLKEYDVKVLGTVFNIDAYSDRPVSTTSLISGKVELTSYTHCGDIAATEILSPNETASIENATGKITVTRGDEDISLAWMEGLYKCKDKSFQSIVNDLERIYNIKIEIKDQGLAHSVYTGSFEIENSIDKVLEPLAKYNKFRFEREKDTIRIYSIKK